MAADGQPTEAAEIDRVLLAAASRVLPRDRWVTFLVTPAALRRGLVTIHALAGHVQVKTSEGERELDAGTLLVLSPGVSHDLHASVPSQVLLTVHMEPTT